MGVNGLLKFLQPQTTPRAISHFAGKTLGVDGYAWLHRAAVYCAEELLRDTPPTRLVQSIDSHVQLFQMHGVKLYFVFDGGRIAMKGRVEAQRRKQRESARAQYAMNGDISKGRQGIEIKPEHAAMVMKCLHARGIPCTVAPYEADAQLVYLEQNGHIDAVLSEDSDMVIFGAKVLITKADARSGKCAVIHAENLPAPLNTPEGRRAVAILAGCDYSRGVYGLGPVKATQMVHKHKSDLKIICESLLKSGQIDKEFETAAMAADLAFQYQRVWNPKKCVLDYLNPVPEELQDQLADSIIGASKKRQDAHRIAVGSIHPDNNTELKIPQDILNLASKLPLYVPARKRVMEDISFSVDKRLRTQTSANYCISPFFKQLPTPDSSFEGSISAFEDEVVLKKESQLKLHSPPPEAQKSVSGEQHGSSVKIEAPTSFSFSAASKTNTLPIVKCGNITLKPINARTADTSKKAVETDSSSNSTSRKEAVSVPQSETLAKNTMNPAKSSTFKTLGHRVLSSKQVRPNIMKTSAIPLTHRAVDHKPTSRNSVLEPLELNTFRAEPLTSAKKDIYKNSSSHLGFNKENETITADIPERSNNRFIDLRRFEYRRSG